MMQRLRATVLGVVVLSAVVAAQGRTVLVTIPETQRQGAFQSGTYDVPADATGIIRIMGTMPEGDYTDTANIVWLRIYVLDPGTQAWRVIAATNWLGGARVDPELGVNPRPYVSFPIDAYRGRQIRAEVDVPVRMRVGAFVDLGPTWP